VIQWGMTQLRKEPGEPRHSFRNAVRRRDRVAKFYKAAFAWNMKNMGEKMGQYVLATTTENGDAGSI